MGAAANTPDMINVLADHGAHVQGSKALNQAAMYRRVCNVERLLQL